MDEWRILVTIGLGLLAIMRIARWRSASRARREAEERDRSEYDERDEDLAAIIRRREAERDEAIGARPRVGSSGPVADVVEARCKRCDMRTGAGRTYCEACARKVEEAAR